MGDIVEVMLRQVMTALMTNDRALASEVSRMDNTVDKLDEAIKLYVTKLTRGSLDEQEGARAMEIISFAINLEHIGDIIDKNLMRARGQEDQAQAAILSTRARRSSAAFHKRIVESLCIALSVFMSRNVSEARKLIAEKTELRNAELAAAERHFERLREGQPETHGDDLAPPRRAARPQAHPLAHLLGRLSGAGGGGRDRRGGRRRKRSHHARRTRRQAGGAVDVRRPRPGCPPLPFTGALPITVNYVSKGHKFCINFLFTNTS